MSGKNRNKACAISRRRQLSLRISFALRHQAIFKSIVICCATFLGLGLSASVRGDDSFCCASCKKLFGGSCNRCCIASTVPGESLECDDGSCTFDFPALCWSITPPGGFLIEADCSPKPLPAEAFPIDIVNTDAPEAVTWQLSRYRTISSSNIDHPKVAREILRESPAALLPSQEPSSRILKMDSSVLIEILENFSQDFYLLRIGRCSFVDPLSIDHNSVEMITSQFSRDVSGLVLLRAKVGANGIVRHVETLYTNQSEVEDKASTALYSHGLAPRDLENTIGEFSVLLFVMANGGDSTIGYFAYSIRNQIQSSVRRKDHDQSAD